ncbi:MAG: hypothetical protein IRZ08_20160, partial [Frankia sp.]|nr:hypothetical protein [Frankia sp.]
MPATPTVPPPADLDDLDGVVFVDDLDTLAASTLGGCGDDNPYRLPSRGPRECRQRRWRTPRPPP